MSDNKEDKSPDQAEKEKERKKFKELTKSMLNPIKAGNVKIFTREELNER